MSKIRVVVADEEVQFREGVCAVLKLCDDIDIVGEATNDKEINEVVRKRTPDIVVMNLVTPLMGSTSLTDLLRKENKDIKVLLLIQDESREWVLSGLRTGANGYISKYATAQELTAAIMKVYRGDYFLDPLITKTMVEDYSDLSKRSEKPPAINRLSPREQETLKMLADGYKCQEIARLLAIEPRTVLNYQATIKRKLGIYKRTELVKYAIREHLVNLD